MFDFKGGWTITHAGEKYRIGYDLKVKQKWLKKDKGSRLRTSMLEDWNLENCALAKNFTA